MNAYAITNDIIEMFEAKEVEQIDSEVGTVVYME